MSKSKALFDYDEEEERKYMEDRRLPRVAPLPLPLVRVRRRCWRLPTR